MIKRPKATRGEDCQTLEQLPNVGPAMAGDLRALDSNSPSWLLAPMNTEFTADTRPRISSGVSS